MKDLRVKDVLRMEAGNQHIKISGWIRTKRDSKQICFLELNDGSCLSNLQIIIDKSTDTFTDTLREALGKANTGASAKISGTLVASAGKNQQVEIAAENLEILGEADPETYPLQKKRHSFEFLREIAHLRPRTNSFGAVARVRSKMAYAIHTFFQERDFIYVDTPVITPIDAEGAGQMFQVTTLPLEKILESSEKIDYKGDFFGKRAFLTVTGQLEAENYACALKNVYNFGPTFRAENSNTSRHLAEFWMMEPEMAFCDIHGNMDIAEAFLKYVIRSVLENCREDMAFFNKWVNPGVIDNLQEVVDKEFVRISYSEAVEQLLKSGATFEVPLQWGVELGSEHEKYLTEHIYKGPVIVTDYPKDVKAFYMKLNKDGKTVRAMDVLVPRLGEIIGGSQREENYDILESRMTESGLDPQAYWWYLELRKYGTVPHSGFGLGFERFVQYVTGMANIRDVIAFPRTVKAAEF